MNIMKLLLHQSKELTLQTSASYSFTTSDLTLIGVSISNRISTTDSLETEQLTHLRQLFQSKGKNNVQANLIQENNNTT